MDRTFGKGRGASEKAYGALRALRNLCLGLALSATAAAAQTVTIAALGDSLTEGYGLPQSDGLVPQLQAWLDARGAEVELINAGVSGDTTAGGLTRVGWTLTPEVDAVIVELGGNDFLRGIDPAVTRANLTGILEATQAAGAEVLLVGLTASGNFGAEYQQAFNAMWPELSEQFGTLLYPDFFAALRPQDATPGLLAEVMQPDGIHPNAEGVARVVEELGPVVVELAERVRAGD